MIHDSDRRPSLDDEVRNVVALCQEVQATEYADLPLRTPEVRRTPAEWFRIVRRIPNDRAGMRTLRRLRRISIEAGALPGALEHYALLGAMQAAVVQVPALPVDPSVKLQFCKIFALAAQPPQPLRHLLDCNVWGYHEIAQTVGLMRFPAGQHHWVMAKAARGALLKLRLRFAEIPRVAAAVLRDYGAFGPVAEIHLNMWRAKPQLMLKAETCRSLHRLARSMELQPHVRGVQGISWLHSKSVADVSPHLTWAREFFVENGALAAEMEVAHPGMGFLVGSAQRQRLFHAGRFKPRVGLLLWKRDDVLAWARRHPEFADDGAALAPPTEPRVATVAAPGRAAPTVGITAKLMPQRFWRAPPAVEP